MKDDRARRVDEHHETETTMIVPMPRRSKGERRPIMVRVPIAHAEAYQRAAQEAGLDVGDYFAAVMAQTHGLEIPDYILEEYSRRVHQEELPLDKTA